MKLDESEEAEGLPAACFRRSVAVKNLDVRNTDMLTVHAPCACAYASQLSPCMLLSCSCSVI